MAKLTRGKIESKNCPLCGTVFLSMVASHQKYCSRRCASSVEKVDSICCHCGKTTKRTPLNASRKKFCSDRCAAKQHSIDNRVKKICGHCENVFFIVKSRENKARFCSNRCAGLAQRKTRGNRAGIVLDRTRPAIVYKAVNLINGKFYIGVTSRSLSVRASAHCLSAKRGDRSRGKSIFMNAIRKYGKEFIRFSIVRHCDNMIEAFEEEKRLIELWKPEYNTSGGGEGAVGVSQPKGKESPSYGKPGFFLGKKHSPETIAKLRKAKGRKLNLSEEMRELRRKQGKALAAREFRPQWTPKRHQEHAQRMTIVQSKPVICVNDGREFSSETEAEKYYALYRGAVSKIIHNPSTRLRSGLVFRRLV